MKLISMCVSNLGPFFGEQSINFATNNNSPITAVVGANGSGKSSLARAMGWALYGEKFLPRYKQLLTINVEAKKKGILRGYVELIFHHADRDYLLKRLQVSEWADLGSTDMTLTLFDVTDKAGAELVSNAQNFVESILPVELTSLFLLDEEQVYGLAFEDDRDLSPICHAIRSLFSLNLFKKFDVEGKSDGGRYLTEHEILKIIEDAVNDLLRTVHHGKFSMVFNGLGNFKVFENGHSGPMGPKVVVSLITHCLSLSTIEGLLENSDFLQDLSYGSFPLFLESPTGLLDQSLWHEVWEFFVKLKRPLFLTLRPTDIAWLDEAEVLPENLRRLHALVFHERKTVNFREIDCTFRGVRIPLAIEDNSYQGTEIKAVDV